MYKDFFGLDDAPFKITPNLDLFYSGGNRGAILDALHYAVANGEGIVKVVGEVGSGKTMLSRMLESCLSPNIETIYIANPSLSRDEILYAVAADLGIPLTGQRTTLIVRELQSRLIEKHAAGRQVVVFIDEAQAMPIESLEEIRLLSNLETSTHKLLQIVLFGQPELDAHLDLPQTRQIRERITHNFHLSPLVRPDIQNYLMFRMRAVGYRGPDVFTPTAVHRIARASRGLIRRINILADKALLAAFSENIHQVRATHVSAAIRDSGFKAGASRATVTAVLLVATAAVGAGAGYVILPGWMARPGGVSPAAVTGETMVASNPRSAAAAKTAPAHNTAVANQLAASIPHAPPAKPQYPLAITPTVAMQATPPRPPTAKPTTPRPTTIPPKANAPVTERAGGASGTQTLRAAWRQTLAATHGWLTHTPPGHHTIQLMMEYGTNEVIAWNTLKRIKTVLSSHTVYVYPTLASGKPAFSFVYGDFATTAAAKAARTRLPPAYQANLPALRTVQGIRDELHTNGILLPFATVRSPVKNPQNAN